MHKVYNVDLETLSLRVTKALRGRGGGFCLLGPEEHKVFPGEIARFNAIQESTGRRYIYSIGPNLTVVFSSPYKEDWEREGAKEFESMIRKYKFPR